MNGRDSQDNGTQCPACGIQGGVYKTVGPTRYRKCPGCGQNWNTRELPAELVDAFTASARLLETHLAHIGALASRLQFHAGLAYELAAVDSPIRSLPDALDNTAG